PLRCRTRTATDPDRAPTRMGTGPEQAPSDLSTVGHPADTPGAPSTRLSTGLSTFAREHLWTTVNRCELRRADGRITVDNRWKPLATFSKPAGHHHRCRSWRRWRTVLTTSQTGTQWI